MLISENVRINRIISRTWKHFLFDIITCSVTYLIFGLWITIPFEIPTLIPTVLGTALAFFIGFNNNQAYDRWWEARKVWGCLVNDSRTWARQLLHYMGQDTDQNDIRQTVRTMLYRHISFVYALKEALRKSGKEEYKQFLSYGDIQSISNQMNKSHALLTLQTRDLNSLYADHYLDGFKFLEMNRMLVNFSDQMGKSERIANTVFPTTYNFYTRFFIWFFIVLVTLVTSQAIGIWSIAAGTLLGYVFLTTHQIGRLLLNPFDDIPTGIPLNQISRAIEINMLETFNEENVPAPIGSIEDEYIM